MDTRKLHRKIREALGPRHTRTLGEAIRYVVECQGDSCRVVEAKESKGCGPSCSCGPCSKREASKKKKPFHGDARLAERAGALLGAALGRARKLLDTSERDITDEVPLKSFADDLRRKKSLRKTMPGVKDEADSKFPEPTDAWQTTEAARAFTESYGGDGMAGADSRPSTDVAPEVDGVLDPADSRANYRYSRDPDRVCGNCAHFSVGDDDIQRCDRVRVEPRPVDVCNQWTEGEDQRGDPRLFTTESAKRALADFRRRCQD